MYYYERPTELHETANAEAMAVFAEHMGQFKGVCDMLRDIESNLSAMGNSHLSKPESRYSSLRSVCFFVRKTPAYS